MLHGAILVNGEEVVRETQMVRFDRAGIRSLSKPTTTSRCWC